MNIFLELAIWLLTNWLGCGLGVGVICFVFFWVLICRVTIFIAWNFSWRLFIWALLNLCEWRMVVWWFFRAFFFAGCFGIYWGVLLSCSCCLTHSRYFCCRLLRLRLVLLPAILWSFFLGAGGGFISGVILSFELVPAFDLDFQFILNFLFESLLWFWWGLFELPGREGVC